jgi:hypothetical protein
VLLSLLIGAICSALALIQAFRHPDSLPFDTREQLIWMWRFVDPGLLPHDPLADYLASVEPIGVATVYRVLAALGLQPFTAAKVLPAAFGLVATWQVHRLATALTRLPYAGVLAAAFLNLSMWSLSDLSSGTARAFLYPVLPWFLAAIMRGRPWEAAAAVAVLAACYPPLGAVATLALLLWSFVDPAGRQSRLPAACAAVLALLIVMPQTSRAREFGPVLTAAEGRVLDELQDDGEFEFFVRDRVSYWMVKFRSGLLATQVPATLTLAAVTPILLLRRRYRVEFDARGRILLWTLLSSVIFWGLAHAMLFRLYQPSRYMLHSLRMVAAVSIGVLLAWSVAVARDRGGPGRWALVVVLAVVAVVPFGIRFGRDGFPQNSVVVGRAAPVYAWLRASPAATVVSSLSAEANNIPALTARTSLTGSDFGLPWHTGYHRAYRQRTADAIEAQYTADAGVLRTIVDRHQISVFLIEKSAFDARLIEAQAIRWLRPYEAALSRAAADIRRGRPPILALAASACQVVETEDLQLIDAACVLRTPAANASR